MLRSVGRSHFTKEETGSGQPLESRESISGGLGRFQDLSGNRHSERVLDNALRNPQGEQITSCYLWKSQKMPGKPHTNGSGVFGTGCQSVLPMNSPYLLGELCEDLGKHRQQLCSATVSRQRHGQEEENEVWVPGEHGHQTHQQAAGLAEDLRGEKSQGLLTLRHGDWVSSAVIQMFCDCTATIVAQHCEGTKCH